MEILRRTVRNFIGANSSFYKTLARGLDTIYILKKEGIWCLLLFRRLRKKVKGETCTLLFNGLKYPFTFRSEEADIRTVIDNFIREEYGQLTLSEDLGWMIDAGAYLGDTSVYFASRYPKLKIVALEPNPESYKIAKDNLECYSPQVQLVDKGLWSEKKSLHFAGEQTGAGVSEEGQVVEVTDIPDLMQRFNIDRIKLLKMDIEGAETEIFSNGFEQWIDLVDAMIIETHGDAAKKAVLNAAEQGGFAVQRYRNLWYFTK